MPEVLEERLDHGRAGAGPAAPARPRPGRAEVALLVVAALTLVHLVDHVLRADASGWPFTRDLTCSGRPRPTSTAPGPTG